MARGKKAASSLSPEEKLQQALVPAEEQPYPIPENWCWVTIGAIASVKGGKRIPKGNRLVEHKTEHPYIRVTDLDNRSIATEQVKYIDEETFKLIRNYTISTQDIYISIAGTIGKVGIIPDDLDGANLTENAAKITNMRGIEKNFLLWLLESEIAQSQMRDSTISTTQPKLALFRIENIKFPLSPLAEQQRIVDRIESLFAKLDEAKEKAQAVVDGFELRKSAILHKAFTGELTERWRKEHGVGLDSWETKTSKELFDYVTSGSRGWAQYYSGTGAVFVRMGNLDHGTIELDFSDVQHVRLPDKAEGQRSRLQKNDILISITADVGMVGLVREMNFEAYINQHIALARPNDENDSEFIAWYLVSDVGLRQMQDKQRGATKVGLGLDDIRSLQLSMPKIAEQKEVVSILNELMNKEQQAKEVAEAVLSQINTMKKAILARALRGELGTNDPAEEWAGEIVKIYLSEEMG